MRSSHVPRRRRGIALVAAIVLLMVVALMLAVMVSRSGQAVKRIVRQDWQTQAEWLAVSGLQRTQAKLRFDPNYDGETWTIAASELGGRHAGAVRIALKEAESDDPKAVSVQVVAEYPAGSALCARVTRAGRFVRTETEGENGP